MQDDNPALERFLISVERRAFRMAQIATGSREDALDIVQDAMLGLVRHYKKKNEGDWQPLFFKILQSRIRDWYRRTAVRNRWKDWLPSWLDSNHPDAADPISSVPAPDRFDPVQRLSEGDFSAALETALNGLPLRQQQAFLLRAWEGMNVSETAAAMQCSEGSVKTHYARALSALRSTLKDHYRP